MLAMLELRIGIPTPLIQQGGMFPNYYSDTLDKILKQDDELILMCVKFFMEEVL